MPLMKDYKNMAELLGSAWGTCFPSGLPYTEDLHWLWPAGLTFCSELPATTTTAEGRRG